MAHTRTDQPRLGSVSGQIVINLLRTSVYAELKVNLQDISINASQLKPYADLYMA